MSSLNQDEFVSDRTQAIFHLLLASGVDLAGLLALVSSAYADGGNFVLNEIDDRIGEGA